MTRETENGQVEWTFEELDLLGAIEEVLGQQKMYRELIKQGEDLWYIALHEEDGISMEMISSNGKWYYERILFLIEIEYKIRFLILMGENNE